MVGCQRQRDGHLSTVLFAELAAVLPRDADRMDAFLCNAGVVVLTDAHWAKFEVAIEAANIRGARPRSED